MQAQGTDTLVSLTGPEVRVEREKRRLRQLELAKAAGMSAGKLSQIETGLVEPAPDDVERLVAVLNRYPVTREV